MARTQARSTRQRCPAGSAPDRKVNCVAQVAREGTKKTVFTNFPELCRSMNRGQEHVMAFLLAELGTR
jgi:translation initiation factor 2 beta subunit (eIF-2beta)/eIF-5